MKTFFLSILSSIIFLASFQNSLLLVDYQINRNFYEIHCINKAKPKMDCHGKCEMKKESEKTSSPFKITKNFEFNILYNKNIEIPKPEIRFSGKEIIIFKNSTENILKGFYEILPHPPQKFVLG